MRIRSIAVALGCTVVLAGALLVLVLVVGRDRGSDPVPEAALREALPTGDEVGDAMGSSSMRTAVIEEGEGGWDRNDIYDLVPGCEAALQEVDDDTAMFGLGLELHAPSTARSFTDRSHADVTVLLASGDEDTVEDVATLVEACPEYEVDGPPRASIRSVVQEEIEPVPVEGDSFAYRQRFVFTDVDNVYDGQVWSRRGVVALVLAIPGIDAEGRPTRTSRHQMEDLVHLVDSTIDDIDRG